MIILLDRNVISLCNQLLEGKIIDKYRKKAIRLLDKNGYIISPLLSIYEGAKGRKETYEEKLITINKEAKILQKYFNKASIDSNFLLNCKEELAEVYSNYDIEKYTPNYLNFIFDLHDLLFQPIAIKNRDIMKKEIFNLANKHNIQKSHIIVIASLAVLYGNDKIREIFKFKQNIDDEKKKKLSYNAFNDLMIVQRVLSLRTILLNKNSTLVITYFTFDKGLMSLLNSIKDAKTSKVELSNMVEFETKITLSNFFPNLDSKGIIELEKEISNN